MVSTVWSVSYLLFFYSRCLRAQPFVKVVARAPQFPMELAPLQQLTSLSDNSFARKDPFVLLMAAAPYDSLILEPCINALTHLLINYLITVKIYPCYMSIFIV